MYYIEWNEEYNLIIESPITRTFPFGTDWSDEENVKVNRFIKIVKIPKYNWSAAWRPAILILNTLWDITVNDDYLVVIRFQCIELRKGRKLRFRRASKLEELIGRRLVSFESNIQNRSMLEFEIAQADPCRYSWIFDPMRPTTPVWILFVGFTYMYVISMYYISNYSHVSPLSFC